MAGVLTRAQMENEALDNVAKSGLLTLQSQTTLATRMTLWVNRAQMWIARRADILQQISTTSTVASQHSYSFPGDLRSCYTLRLIDGLMSRKLTCVMPWEMDKRVAYPEALTTYRSIFYTPFTQTLTFELFPIPDAAYTLNLRYSYYPSDITTSTGVSQYTNCDDAIIAYATMFAFRWLQELKDAKDWEGWGNDIIKRVEETFDESAMFPDWAPAAEGFSAHAIDFTGDYWNSPFVRDSNLSTWWR